MVILSKKGNPAEPEKRAAGRPKGYWEGLLSDASLAPLKKPDPKPKVERLPESQLRDVISLLWECEMLELGGASAISGIGAWMDDLQKLHHEDSKAIMVAALRLKSSALQEKVRQSIPLLPAEGQVDMFGHCLASHMPQSYLCDLFERISKISPDADNARLVRIAFKSSAMKLQKKALGLISSLPGSERAETVRAALAVESIAMTAFGCIEMCPEQDRARLIKAALRSPSKAVSDKAFESIHSLTGRDREVAVDIVIAKIWGVEFRG